MTRTLTRSILLVLLIAFAMTHLLARAHAQSSLGIGANEAIAPSPGFLGGFMQWVNVHQQQFYRSLTGALRGMREDGAQLWILIGLSFAYGVFHAAGPGHGKAVISSYMLANEVALRRGVMLSFLSAFLQAVTAFVVIGLVALVLRGTSISMTNATTFLEISSYVMVTAFGAWLLWKKLVPRLVHRFRSAPKVSLSSASAALFADVDNCHDPRPAARTSAFKATATEGRSDPYVCETCGQSHMPDPAMLGGDRFDWRAAWSAVLAVGLRPCTGALIVLSFALLNGLWLGGIASVLAMSLGTAITVSAIAILAVSAKNVAVTLAGDGRTGNMIHAAIEIGGALLVFLLGLTLLTASLGSGGGLGS